jgi:hypothetical protein
MLAARVPFLPVFSDLSFQLRPEMCEGWQLEGLTTDRGQWINLIEFSDFMQS